MQLRNFFIRIMRFLINILVYVVVILVISCSDPKVIYLNDSSMYLDGGEAQYNKIPYANDEKLKELANERGVLDYRIVRKTAIIEFEMVYRTGLKWPKGVRLSKLPVVLYNTESEPELYEFIVLKGEKPIGVIATSVRPIRTEVIKNVLPYVRNYQSYGTKYKGYDQIIKYYPSEVYVGIATKGSGVKNIINPYTGEQVRIPIEKREEGKTKKDKEFEKVVKEYWDVILQHKKEIIAMKDEEIYAQLRTKWKMNTKKFSRRYIVEKFRGFEPPVRSAMARTRWEGWCVPAAIAQLVWVWNDGKYNGEYIPNVDDGNFLDIKGFPQEFAGGFFSYFYKSKYVRKSYIHSRGHFVGSYRFVSEAEPGVNRKNDLPALTNLQSIKYLSTRIDNGLYSDIVNSIIEFKKKSNSIGLGGGTNTVHYKEWDGGASILEGAKAARKLTKKSKNGQMKFDSINSVPRIISNHIRTEGPVLDGVYDHSRLLIGVIYSWQERSTQWYAHDEEAQDLKWGWLWVKANWWKTHVWNKHELNKTLGYSFLIWDNGTNTASYYYLPYWESYDEYTRRDAIGFYW